MMKRSLTPLVLASAAVMLSACGSDSNDSTTGSGDSGGANNGNNGNGDINVSVTPDYQLDVKSSLPIDFGNALTELNAINPDPSSMYVTGTVLKTTKPAGAETWAGSTVADQSSLALSEERSVVTAWVYSPEAGIPVLFKVENDADASQFAEVLVTTSKANEWEQLTFDFRELNLGELNEAFKYNKKSLFFDFGNVGSGNVFYWDNLRLEGVGLSAQPTPDSFPVSDSGQPLLGNPQYQAISYGAWRSDTRESGDLVPTVQEHVEDMKILNAMGIKVIRTYNTQGFIGTDGYSNTENLLAAIRQLKDEAAADGNTFEMYVMLGVWIDANNAWTGSPIDSSTDSPKNALEIAKAKELALAYPDIIKVIAVGNEAMVDWASSYKVHPSIILNHVKDLQSWKLESSDTDDLWITTSDNWAVWAGIDNNGNYGEQADLKSLIQAVDYVSLHTYAHHDTHYDPIFKEDWKVSEADQSLSKEEQIAISMQKAYTRSLEQYAAAQAFVNSVDPTKPIHIGETGWSTSSTDGYGAGGTQAADEYKQKMFHDDMRDFANNEGVSLFFFQAFDEPWKGGDNPGHSEKNFGLIDIDCNVKYVAWDKVDTLNDLGLTRDCNGFTASYGGVYATLMDDVLAPPYAPVEQPPVEGEFKVLGSALFSGAGAFAWEDTAWAGVDEDGVLTVATSPTSAKDWGWGTHIGDESRRDFTAVKTLKFDIRGFTEGGKALAEFAFGVGFQSDTGGQWSTNHTIRFNTGDYQLTTDWQTIEVDISQFSNSPNLTQVTQPFIVNGTTKEGLTEADIQVRNISWFE
ncbi:hypothetical protein [Vibrio maritimus]|uniref:hypothetical protein n=1 Tax=Vibrio maritimus TaxID=990268 RepID=UPI001F2AE0DF|nr:hypothetical protein [Vibrio maritimus]